VSSAASIAIDATTRPRLAPSAVRIAKSRWRAALRASSRFATLGRGDQKQQHQRPDDRPAHHRAVVIGHRRGGGLDCLIAMLAGIRRHLAGDNPQLGGGSREIEV
jgi:hypothetical protein